MRILIVGCGYLGKRAALAWRELGHDVFAMTRTPEHGKLFQRDGIRPLIGDICEPESLKGLPNVDIVLQAVGFDRASGRGHDEVTIGGMQHVLDATSDRCSHFIHISSTSVYGQTAGEWVNEDADCEPAQANGQMTLAAEQLVRDRFSNGSGRRCNILRLAGIYGPGRLLSRVDALRNGLTLAGRGDSWLNLIYVDDAVSAIFKMFGIGLACDDIQCCGRSASLTARLL